jgi:hypothetical protein
MTEEEIIKFIQEINSLFRGKTSKDILTIIRNWIDK